RRIHGPNIYWSGDPAPTSANGYPASLVKGRVTPGGVIDPRVTPGSNPVPVAGVIGRPAGFHVREPDVAVARIVAPVTIVVEVFVADDVARQILGRGGIVVAMIATIGPGIKLVGSGDVNHLGVQRIRSAESAS